MIVLNTTWEHLRQQLTTSRHMKFLGKDAWDVADVIEVLKCLDVETFLDKENQK